MTRKEEIARASKDHHLKHYPNFTFGEYVSFIDGAKWADRTMIKKACEWLRVELDKEEERHYIHVHGFDKERREIFLEDFRKSMKGD